MVLRYIKLHISVKQKEIMKTPEKIPCGISSRAFAIKVQKTNKQKKTCKEMNSNEGK